ncbi:MAG: hypothetical protein ABOK23_10730 [Candidatus Methanoperedens sp.]|nr:hypothetical protein [Candidatus Methanoperedens sp.]MCZ7394192.1 hypothetical protein [Candidatus Methanoperedens sp.]
MKKPTLYLYGTVHSSKKSKSDLSNIFNRYKIDAVLSEGVETQYQKMFQKEPFLACPYWVYFNCIKIMGSEFTLAKELANNSEIPIINMDKSLNEIIDYFHKPYINIVLIIIIADILLAVVQYSYHGAVPLSA